MGELVRPEDIRSIRESLGLTQGGLAGLVGLTRSQISRIESGASWPRQSSLKRISQALISEKVRQTRLELVKEPQPEKGLVWLEEGVKDAPSILEVLRPEIAWLESVMVRVTSKHSGCSRVMTAIEAMTVAEGFEHDFEFEVVRRGKFSPEEVYRGTDLRRLPDKVKEWSQKKG